KASEDTVEARTARLQMARRVLEADDAGVSEMAAGLLSPGAAQAHPVAVQHVRDWLVEAPPKGVAAAQRAMASRPDRLSVLQTLRVPSLVLYGSEDAITGAPDHETMARALGT